MSSSLQNTSFISTSTHIITHITYYISKRAIRQVKFLILDEFNKPLYLIGCVNEIGKRQKADNISGLLREPSLEEYISYKSKNNITGYFMQIGIDDFEEINGRFGLKCGDEILKQFSRSMQSFIN